MPPAIEIKYYVFPDGETLSHQAAAHLTARLTQSIQERGRARIALSGGNTPRRMLELLGDPEAEFRSQIPWQQLEIFFVDERAVPPEDAESNYRMVREALLDKVPIQAVQVARMPGELNPQRAAALYETEIRMRFRLEGAEIPRFDVVALGMGDDGHAASLFPHTGAIDALGRIVVANHVPQKNAWRITLSWPVLNQARGVFFLVQGSDKAEVLERVLTGPFDPKLLPSQLIRPASGKLTLFLDSAAAALLPPPGADGFGSLERTR
jgi:6-phosphogluconolactonase